MLLLAESGIDVGINTIGNAAEAVAPAMLGPVKGTLVSTGIKTVRGFVDRIQKVTLNSDNDGIHTNRYIADKNYIQGKLYF